MKKTGVKTPIPSFKTNLTTIKTACNKPSNEEQINCLINPSCFFCIMKEPDSSTKKSKITNYIKKLPFLDDYHELILVVSGIWNMAMTNKADENQELPCLGIFECMSFLIHKGIKDGPWIQKNQNIYIPYYAAHIIGSYTINNVDHARKSVDSGVIPPLMELLSGKISWVEQRVAVRALGHLASYDETFQDLLPYEEEIVKLCMHLASTCLEEVFEMFIAVKDKRKRLKYMCDLLTRGNGGFEEENLKAGEWASQIQCWCLHLLSCFAMKKRSLDLICTQEFLKQLSEMWGGLSNNSSPSGVGLIRILCYTKEGRESIAKSRNVLDHLCNLTRSSDNWQYMAIDCLLLLLSDPDTRHKVVEVAAFLIDLVELRSLGGRSNLGERIASSLILDFKQTKTETIKNRKVQKVLEELWNLKVLRRKKEQRQTNEKAEEKRVIVNLIKQQGNQRFCMGDIKDALLKYTKALDLCPLRFRNERLVLFSNRSQCNLLLKDPDSAISDATRALCLSNPPNSHAKSLWRRSQAYDMKGLAKESLMDCIMFITCGFFKSSNGRREHTRIPYYALTMINKQMHSTWLFRKVQSKSTHSDEDEDDNIKNMEKS
ncbi:hypothetical protein Leryth_008745 [Lithospermum erythrorhizon]|nr:hypothetical protein Leryth_008745 [Lithospermum erythrorhizon]